MPIRISHEPDASPAATGSAAVPDALLQADRLAALGTLAAGVAHEINNPLTYVIFNVEHSLRSLRSHLASSEPVEMDEIEAHVTALVQTLDGANRIRRIVRNLMTFANGQVESKSIVDVVRVLQAALQMTAHELRYRTRVETRLREVPRVLANEAQLGQVFLNLLTNAARAVGDREPASNVVTVESSTDEAGRAVVVITDTGGGIAPDDLPRVFDPFFTTHRAGDGTGLGLSIAHGIVRSLGGTLSAESTLGQGSRFRVCLPPAPGYDRSGHGSATFVAAGARLRVLVVDEDASVASAIAKSLSPEHDAAIVTESREALARLDRGDPYDVILCDLMMPALSGMDFYREVVRIVPRLASRVFFMTGGVYTPRARAFVEAMPNRCIVKPPDSAKLRELLRRCG